MNDAVLKQFRDMASKFSLRPRENIDIELRNGTVLHGTYDPFFNQVTLGGMSIPAVELSKWTRLCWGSRVTKVVKRISPVSTQAEN